LAKAAAPKVVAKAAPKVVAKAAPKVVAKAAPAKIIKAVKKAAPVKIVRAPQSLLVSGVFSPVQTVETNPFKDDIGAVGLMGFWDPADLVKDGDPVKFARLRASELKHGRICQLAVLGHITTTAGVRLDPFLTPGYDLKNFPTGLAALSALPAEVVFGTILTIALIEGGYAARKDEIEAAQLAASLKIWDEKTYASKQAIEVNQGRAAMMGILALMVHEKLNNDPYIINSLFFNAPVAFNAGF